MFKSGESSGSFNGFLDAGSHIQGELQFEDEFRIDGKVTGKVSSKGDLILGEGGEVDGEVAVGRVFVSGTLKGTVDASRQIEISPGGRVFANVSTPSLVIQDGAIFEGNCSMKKAPAANVAEEPAKASLKSKLGGSAKPAAQKA